MEHNLWNYIFFISYLKNKEKTEYTGFESYISDKLENNDLTWFPLHKYDFLIKNTTIILLIKVHYHFLILTQKKK